MKKVLTIIFLSITILSFYSAQEARAQRLVDSLTTIDPELRKYFPRWRICEPDLQYQVYQAFALLGFDRDLLDMQDIEVLAAPRGVYDNFYDILMISSGEAALNAREIDNQMRTLADYISGRKIYDRTRQGDREALGVRTYCFQEIPPEIPLSMVHADAIQNYLQPDNVDQAISLSLFEQSVKIGESGFWIKNQIGTDDIGYPFWYAGESKLTLRRPLYNNQNTESNQRIPYLINAYLGGAYRISSGVDPSGVFSWVPQRRLNAGPGGKLIGGLDVHMPFHADAGVHLNLELPLQDPAGKKIDPLTYAKYFVDDVDTRVVFDNGNVVPILQATGQFTLFYNWWINKRNPENYFRFDIGINYAEVQEYTLFQDEENAFLLDDSDPALTLYKPESFGEWMYGKIEYRNQAAYPFSISVQVSNQVLLTRAFIPLLGDWLLIEGKYSTPLRDARPYEIENFFMISPVLRLTI